MISNSNKILKKMLTNIENVEILKNFIESILNIKILKIIYRPYIINVKKFLPNEEEFGIVDVRIIKANGEQLNIGIQIIDGYYVENKILLYYAQVHSKQTEYKTNNSIVKTITINILDFNYFNTRDYHKIIDIKQNVEKNSNVDSIELHVLELPKFKITKNIKLTNKEAWIAYLKGKDKNIIEMAKEKYENIRIFDSKLEKYWKEEIIE